VTERVTTTINGAPFSGEVLSEELLLDFLRDRLGLTGTKQSCEVQVCGACTVLVDGDPVSSCCFLAADIDGREVETIEGLATTEFHRRAAEAFTRHAAVQCGFCTPGMLLTAKALAARGARHRDEIAAAMNGNLCRCTGYRSILDSLTDLLADEAAPAATGEAR
jgi:aerobic-type carbon monoxide dehydrogenase small subunit (CoxS/CutS family)